MNFGDPRLPDRFWSKCTPEPMSGCWLWHGALANGYGQLRVGAKAVSVHRLSYEAFVGPIPSGLSIDHRCEVTCCVNPVHLDVCTSEENTRRHFRRHPVTHCPRGHEKTAENLYVSGDQRHCKACHAVSVAARVARLVDAGTCIICGSRTATHGQKCERCATAQHGYTKRWRARQRAA